MRSEFLSGLQQEEKIEERSFSAHRTSRPREDFCGKSKMFSEFSSGDRRFEAAAEAEDERPLLMTSAEAEDEKRKRPLLPTTLFSHRSEAAQNRRRNKKRNPSDISKELEVDKFAKEGFLRKVRRKMKVKHTLATLFVLFSLLCLVRGWGGMFNRFNPSMLSNLGYGSSYGSKLYSAAGNAEDNTYKSRRYQPARQDVEEAINEIIAEEEEEDPCEGKKCTANEHCCDGHVCVDLEDEMNRASYGTCMPIFGHKLGEECKQDHDCETGYLCRSEGGAKSCQLPVSGSQELGEDCNTSSDCDISRGLCCKLQRRARSQPKKLCAYFSDPLMCIGKVSSNLIRSSIEHTGGEKRRSSHPDYRHLRR